MSGGLTNDVTLGDARKWLKDRVYAGERCPCCHQFSKVYRRAINNTQARALVVIYRTVGDGWGHLPDLRMALAPHHSNEEPKLRYWGLLEEELTVRPDGGRAGWWRVTALGEQWVSEDVSIPKYVHIYDGERIGQPFGEPTTIRDALGTKFNLDELMGRTA
jgi:hypothetical protein